MKPQDPGDVDLKALFEAVEADPDSPEPRRRLAWELCARDRIEEGITQLRELLRMQPRDSQSHAILGEALMRKGLWEDSEKSLREAIGIDPLCSFAHWNLGVLFQNLKRPQEALTAFNQALKARLSQEFPFGGFLSVSNRGNSENPAKVEGFPQPGLIIERIAHLHILRQDWNKALETIQEGLARESASPNLLLLAGQILEQLGRPTDAARIYEKVTGLLPTQGIPYRFWGRCLRDLGKLEEALTLYRKSADLSPDDVDTHFEMGTVFSRMELKKDAATAYGRAAELAPDDPMCHYNLGCVLIETREFDRAMAHLKRAVDLNGTDPRFHHNLGISARNLGKLDEAETALRNATRLKPDFHLAWRDLGVTLGMQGRLEEALEAYRTVLRLNPDYATANLDLGMNLVRLGRFDEAMDSLDQAVRLRPDLFPAWVEHLYCAILAERSDVVREDVEIHRELLKTAWTTNPGFPPDSRASPLSLASFLGKGEIVKALLEAGATPAPAGSKGRSAEELALEGGHPEIRELLRAASTSRNPSSRNPSSRKPSSRKPSRKKKAS